MSEEKKCINNEELCEGKQKLSIEELENVNGGGALERKGKHIATLDAIAKDASATPVYVVEGAN